MVVGCGFGFLVKEFEKLGKQVLGIDASEWAVTNRVNDHVLLSDILEGPDVAILGSELGPFGTVITEDLLPYLDDAEVIVTANNCSVLAPIVTHMVTVQGEADLNYHSLAEWMNMTNQLTVSLEGM